MFDLGQSVALANTDMFAQYKVQTWDDIPDANKDPKAFGSTTTAASSPSAMTPTSVPAPTSLDDLLGSDYKGKVALNGDPTSSGSGLAGVMMASLANGGSADDLAPGVDYFKQLNDAGNLIPVDVTPGDDRVGPDAGRHGLGLPERRRDQGAPVVEGHGP